MANYVLKELAERRSGSGWAEKLEAFVDSIQERARNWSPHTEFAYQKAIAIPKARPGNNQEYRGLAVFGLEDTVICAGFSAYLQHAIDPIFTDSCIAFRAPPHDGSHPTHHDAVRRIMNYRADFSQNQAIWCAECDIEGFFDAVDHGVVRKRVAEICDKLGLELDPRFSHFLNSFLRGYNYHTLCSAAKAGLQEQQKILKPRFKDISKILHERNIASSGPIGIPQGSFLSCVLANAVLAEADRACQSAFSSREPGEGLYLRYCDDIILLHRSRAVCTKALDGYLNSLSSLQLPYHKPLQTEKYGQLFWKAKSKLPFPWRTGLIDRASSWISFVGYQVHRDGRVRVRERSIQRQMERQRATADKIIGALRAFRRTRAQNPVAKLPSERSIRTRILYHFLSISVGIPRKYCLTAPQGKMCWAAGFPLTREFECSWRNVRLLDRERRRSLRRISAAFRSLAIESPQEPRKNDRDSKKSSQRDWNLIYDGPEFSYAYAVRGITGAKPRPTGK